MGITWPDRLPRKAEHRRRYPNTTDFYRIHRFLPWEIAEILNPRFATQKATSRGIKHYPMESQNYWSNGCWQLHDFPTPSDPNSHRSWDKSKNLYRLGNHTCIILDKAIVGGPGTTQPVVVWSLDPEGCPIRNYAISQWVWVLAIMSDTSAMQYDFSLFEMVSSDIILLY